MMKEQVSQIILDAIGENRIMGAIVMVAKGGEIICEAAEGYFDKDHDISMKPGTIFRLASVTKLYVAAATMVLASRNKLKLEDPVSLYLPYFTPKLADGSVPEITIRHLLTHTSGLSYGFLEVEDGPLHKAGVSDGMDLTGISLEENLRRLSTVPLNFQPGSAWLYSLAFDVLGGILEKVENKALPFIIEELITGPLNIQDTGFQIKDTTRLAPAYMNASPTPVKMRAAEKVNGYEGFAPVLMSPSRAFEKNAFPSGGAGMLGTPADLVVLLEALRTGTKIITSSVLQEMAENQTKDLSIPGWPGWGHGLGCSVLVNPKEGNTPESVGTWRWGGAYGHSWFMDREKELTVVAFTNTALEGMSGGGRFPLDIRDVIYKGLSEY